MLVRVILGGPICRIFFDRRRIGRPEQRVQVDVNFSDGVVGRVRVVVHDPNCQRLVLKDFNQIFDLKYVLATLFLPSGLSATHFLAN